MQPSARNVAQTLPARGAVSPAAQLGCDLGAIDSSPVFRADGAPLLILTSGAHRVDGPSAAARTAAQAGS